MPRVRLPVFPGLYGASFYVTNFWLRALAGHQNAGCHWPAPKKLEAPFTHRQRNLVRAEVVKMKQHIFFNVRIKALLVEVLSLARLTRQAQYRVALLTGLLLAVSLISLVAYGQTNKSKRGVQAVTSQPESTTELGKYYALVIGNNNYKYVAKLKTAVNDADAVGQLLRDRYGFTVKVLHDATRDNILTALNEYRRTLPVNSNLVIYYAGHGYKDPDTNEAYWLPVDAEKDNNQDWISADDIAADAHAIPSMHLLIVSDSCFSGELARDADVGITSRDRETFLTRLGQAKSRNLMSSGGNEPVADGGAPGHSVFASAVLDSLNRIEDDKFTASELFSRFIQQAVAGSADQIPQYGYIRKSGHNAGDFVFSRKPDKNAKKGPKPEAPASSASSNRANTDSSREDTRSQASVSKKKVPQGASLVAANSNSSAGLDNSAEEPATRPSLVKKIPRPTTTADVPNTMPTGQRYTVAHYSSIDPKQLCIGLMTVDNGMIHFRGQKGTPGVHNFDFPLSLIKEIKQNDLIFSALHAFHIRLNTGEVQNFSLFDAQSGAYLSPDLLLNEARI